MQIENREIPINILLSILTCGIYSLYWIYCILKDTYTLCNYTEGNPALDVVLIIITCTIYGLFLYYKIGKMQQYLRGITNQSDRDNSVVYLVLKLIGLAFIGYAIMQSELNTHSEYIQANGDSAFVNNRYDG